MVDLWFMWQTGLPTAWDTRSKIKSTVSQATQGLQQKGTPIAGLNKPTIGSDFATPQKAEKTQFTQMPKEAQSQIKKEVVQPTKQISPEQAQNIKVEQPKYDMKQIFGELGATIESNPRMDIEELKGKFPELASVDTQVFWELGATIQANPNLSMEEIMFKFPEITDAKIDDPEAGMPWIVKWATRLMDKWSEYEWFGWPIIRWVANFFQWLVGWADETGEWLKNIFERGDEVNEQAIRNDIVMTRFKQRYGKLPDMENPYDQNIMKQIVEDLDGDELYADLLEQRKAEQEAIDVVPLQKSILDVAEWGFSTALNIVAPTAMVWLTIWAETKVWAPILEWLGKVISFWGRVINYIPWLHQFRNSLSAEDQERMDALVWNAALLFMAWAKYKGQKITEPMRFLKENLNPAEIINKFNERVVETPWKVVETIRKIPEKIKELPKEILKKEWEGVDLIDRVAANVFGLDAATVSQMRLKPELIKAIEEWTLSKEGIKADLLKIVDDYEMQKGDIGKRYNELYQEGTKFKSIDLVNDVIEGLKSKWVEIDASGKIKWFDITADAMARTQPAELALIKTQYNNIMNTLKGKSELDIQQTHNIKKSLGNARYTDGVLSKKSPILGEISDVVNKRLKKVEWWEALDKEFSSHSTRLRELIKIVENKQWEFKGTIKSLLWERQYSRLQELEKIYPWLEAKIESIKAYDDYIRTRETQKVWHYNKMIKWVAWGGIGAWIWYAIWGKIGWYVGWLLGTLVANKLTDPKLLKDFLIKSVPEGVEIVAKLEVGKALTETQQNNIIEAIQELPKQTESLPSKPKDVPSRTNITDNTSVNAWLKQAWSKTSEKGLQAKEWTPQWDLNIKPKKPTPLNEKIARPEVRVKAPESKLVKIWQYTEAGKEWKFWTKSERADESFGSIKKEAYVDPSKLYKWESSVELAIEKWYYTKLDSALEKQTWYKSLKELLEKWPLWDWSKIWKEIIEWNPNEVLKVFQDKAEAVLKKEWYDWAHWTMEDDLNPTQYQIWNKDILSTKWLKPKSKGLDVKGGDLEAEARKYKSAEEFIKKQLNDNSYTLKSDITVYRGEGKWIGNSTLVNWRYFADSKKFAENFWNVTESIIPKWTKIFDLDTIKFWESKLVSDQSLVSPNDLTDFLVDNGFEYTKNTNSRWVEYVKLDRTLGSQIQIREFKQYEKYDKKVWDLVDKYKTREAFINNALKRNTSDFQPSYFAYKEFYDMKTKWLKPKKYVWNETTLKKIREQANK